MMTIRKLIGAIAVLSLMAGCDLGDYTQGGGNGEDGGFLPPGTLDAGNLGPRPDAAPWDPSCSTCHGDSTSSAPPKDLSGDTATSASGVGAHRAHLDPNPTWHKATRCEDCHQVPTEVSSPGHMDDGDNKAESSWSALATTDGASPAYNGSTCSNVYCHGSTLSGGTITSPNWTIVDGSQDACGTCHGFPPPAPHSDIEDCGACHPTIQPGTTTFLDPNSHINGVLDVSTDELRCDSCHGSDGNPAPPKDLDGNTARSAAGVGAHRQHVGAAGWHREIFCSDCHVVPTEVDDPGHMDDGDNKAELPFGNLNPQATYNASNTTCNNLWCHGDARGNNGTIDWTSDPDLQCGDCHPNGWGLGGEHGEHFGEGISDCIECHQEVASDSTTIIGPDLHINGTLNVKIRKGGNWDPNAGTCSSMECHRNERW